MFSLVATKYDEQAIKPLNVSSEFTYKIRNWAVKPYIDIKAQSTPCETPYEPLFVRHWNGTSEYTSCEGGDCSLKPEMGAINQTSFYKDELTS